MTKKKHSGHYCQVCGRHRANEKFSGKGHAKHICQACESEQKRRAKLKRKGITVEPYSPPPPPLDDLIYHLDDEDETPFDPNELYWTHIRPYESE